MHLQQVTGWGPSLSSKFPISSFIGASTCTWDGAFARQNMGLLREVGYIEGGTFSVLWCSWEQKEQQEAEGAWGPSQEASYAL